MSANDYEARVWKRLAELAEQAVVKVGEEPNYRLEFDGLKFVQLIGQEAKAHEGKWLP